MKFRSLQVILVIVAIHSSKVSSEPFLGDLLGSIAGRATKLYDAGEVAFMGNNCQYTLMPTFRSWELYHEGKFWCPGLAPFSGSGRALSRDGGIEKAQKDYARKLVDNKIFKEEDLKIWLT